MDIIKFASPINNSLYVLIDFDNHYRRSLTSINRVKTEIKFDVNNIVNYFYEEYTFEKVIIRLYGGWYKGSTLTKRASELAGIIPSLNQSFSGVIAKNKVNIKIELATALVAIPNEIWDNTLKEKKGIRNLRVIKDTDTECSGSCPAKAIKKYTRKKSSTCNICSASNSMVLGFFEQKMVDTMLSSDLLYISQTGVDSVCLVLSEDIDFFPAIALAKNMNDGEVYLSSRNKSEFQNELIRKYKIKTYEHS